MGHSFPVLPRGLILSTLLVCTTIQIAVLGGGCGKCRPGIMLESKSEPSAMCHETGFWFWKKTDCWSTTNSWFEIKNTAECALHEGEIQVILRDRSGEDFELGGEYFGEWNSGENRGRFDCFSGTEKISIVITAREGNAKFVLYGCPENGDQSFPKRVPFD